MDNKILQNKGLSLIEVVLVVGILATLIQCAYLIGVPEYKHYVLNSEKNYFVDTLLESRSEALTVGKNFGVRVWGSGYCKVGSLDTILCNDEPYSLPSGVIISGIVQGIFSAKGDFSTTDPMSTSTIVKISDGGFIAQINIDQYGFIDGR